MLVLIELLARYARRILVTNSGDFKKDKVWYRNENKRRATKCNTDTEDSSSELTTILKGTKFMSGMVLDVSDNGVMKRSSKMSISLSKTGRRGSLLTKSSSRVSYQDKKNYFPTLCHSLELDEKGKRGAHHNSVNVPKPTY